MAQPNLAAGLNLFAFCLANAAAHEDKGEAFGIMCQAAELLDGLQPAEGPLVNSVKSLRSGFNNHFRRALGPGERLNDGLDWFRLQAVSLAEQI